MMVNDIEKFIRLSLKTHIISYEEVLSWPIQYMAESEGVTKSVSENVNVSVIWLFKKPISSPEIIGAQNMGRRTTKLGP